jgi:hypothetical protein
MKRPAFIKIFEQGDPESDGFKHGFQRAVGIQHRELVLAVSEARVGEYGVGSAKENSARREEGVAG